jgi:hypothetical protein
MQGNVTPVFNRKVYEMHWHLSAGSHANAFFLHKTFNIFSSKFFYIMVKSFFSKKFGKMGIAVFAMFAFLTLSGVTAFAQEQARAQAGQVKINPAAGVGGELGIAQPDISLPGEWKNVAAGEAYLQQELSTLKLSAGTLSPALRLRLTYYSYVAEEMSYSIAPEIATLSSLGKAIEDKLNAGVSKAQAIAEYKLLKSKF